MLINKPHQQKKEGGNFLVKELQFDENQRERFRFFDSQYREIMMNLDHEIRASKDVLFNSFSDSNFSADSISKRIGELEGEKGQEMFTFFKQVRNICTEEQALKFDKVIKKALHKKGEKPTGRGMRPPPPPR